MKKISEHTIIGVAACAGVYLFVFVYLQVSSFTGFGKKTQFNTYSKLEDDGIRLKAENIDAGDFSAGNVSSISRDVNDVRNSSADDWSESTYEEDLAESAKDIEQQFIDETGGDEKREELVKEHQARLEELKREKTTENKPSNSSSENQFSGEVMVEWELQGRTAYKNDNWHIRNPGYTCGYNSRGTIVVRIKVNKNGNVIDAQIENSSSPNTSSCMKSKALEYARKSRFNYIASASNTQTGYISYKFISQ
ncbi:energy transducer TonB [Crocinitomicaceae bacterium]|nr:energy transducer TonB [Crocinitomicaceae bacterium]